MPNQDDPERDHPADEFDTFWSSLWNNPPKSFAPSGSPVPTR